MIFGPPGPGYGAPQRQAMAPQQQNPLTAFLGGGQRQGGSPLGAFLTSMGMALAADNPAAGAAYMGQFGQTAQANRQQARQRAQTLNWLRTNRPDLAAEYEAGAPWDYVKQRITAAPQATYRALTPDEIAARGLNPNNAYQINEANRRVAQVGGGGVTINQAPNIPSGYMAQYDDQNRFVGAVPIPGGPVEAEQQAAAQAAEARAGKADISSGVITRAAARAREAAGKRMFGPYGQGVVGALIPQSDAAEVANQVETLKALGTLENLNAMRQASPTGGALGNVTEGEGQKLAAASGALDPSNPNFERDLADYERTLLEVVHGPEEGRRIFEATRAPKQRPANVPADLWEYMTEEERAQF